MNCTTLKKQTEEILELVNDVRYCKRCQFWDMDGARYFAGKLEGRNEKTCALFVELITIIESIHQKAINKNNTEWSDWIKKFPLCFYNMGTDKYYKVSRNKLESRINETNKG